MIPLSQSELAMMADTQIGSMQDLCQHMIEEKVQDQYGEITVTYVNGPIYQCGYDPGASSLYIRDEGQTVIINATLRLPLSAAGRVKSGDAFVLLQRYGKPLIDQPTYKMYGDPQIGPSAIVAMLQTTRL